jgi:hypothetical protein
MMKTGMSFSACPNHLRIFREKASGLMIGEQDMLKRRMTGIMRLKNGKLSFAVVYMKKME